MDVQALFQILESEKLLFKRCSTFITTVTNWTLEPIKICAKL